MLSYYPKQVIIIGIILFAKFSLFAQVNISGPACVIPSIEYQYNINANWKDSSELQICVQGGVLADSSLCYNGQPVSFIRVVWSPADGSNRITIHSSTGDASFPVSLTSLLTGGRIDSLSKMQIVDSLTTPVSINCSDPTGGACLPSYEFQWQQSQNNMSWADVDGAINPNLVFSSPVSQTTYYRRKVIEKMSRTESYSDIAIVSVNNTIAN